MLKITKQTNSIQVVGVGNTTYPYNGTLTFPFNTVVLTLDSSNMAVFRSVANNDVLFSALVDDITIDGAEVTKEDIVDKFIAIANVSSSGGGTADSIAWENVTNKPAEIENITTELGNKQDTLVSGSNIKTINGETLLGNGDITIQGGGGSYTLPVASAETLGGIKVGTGLTITEDGTTTAVGKADQNSYNKTGEIFNDYTNNKATGKYSHAEGNATTASGYCSHAEGNSTTASGDNSHAEGWGTTASGDNSHAEGMYTTTKNFSEHAQGKYNKSNSGETDSDKTIHSIGVGSYSNEKNAVEVMTNGDVYIVGIGDYDGTNYASAKTLQEVVTSSSGGGGSYTLPIASADTLGGIKIGTGLTVDENGLATAVGKVDTNSDGTGEIFNDYTNNKATGKYSHAEGMNTNASGDYSHSEGFTTTASGGYSHAEGQSTTANKLFSHAEGVSTNAIGISSHAEGNGTTAQNDSEHAQGSYNVSHKGSTDSDKTIHSIGIGTSDSDKKNAVEVMKNGDVYIVGVGGYDGTNYSTAKSVQELLTELSTLLPQA